MKTWGEGALEDKLKKEVENFLSGKDILLDQKLVKWDILSAIAHGMMLEKIGILTKNELKQISKQLIKLYENGLVLKPELEDVHSNIEANLIQKSHKTGKKINTAISRNEKIIVDLKLYMKNEIIDICKKILKLSKTIAKVSEKYKNSVMPGYTHHQQAMPYTFGSFLMAYFYSLMDDVELLQSAYKVINKNPLGSGAGYGLPIDVDKELTTSLLGFENSNQNSLYHINSRGKNELTVLSALSQLMLDLNKIAEDFILFSMKEFNFIELPEEYATGSSIMPQKKNPDVFELIKGKASIVLANLFQIILTMKNLPSGYNRDLQETKGSLMNSIDLVKDCLDIINGVIAKVKINEEKMKKSLSNQIFATHYAFSLVDKGKSYKEAYKIAANKIKSGEKIPESKIKSDIGEYQKFLKEKEIETNKIENQFKTKINNLIKLAKENN